MTALIACDLDGTLIYSRRSLGSGVDAQNLRCVETIGESAASFMTVVAAERLAELSRSHCVVPVSARSMAQFQRLELPGAIRYTVLANGGIMLVDGQLDRSWSERVAKSVSAVASFAEVCAYVRRCGPGVRTIAAVDGLYCYAVLDDPHPDGSFMAEQAQWAQSMGWRTSLQGRKFYWVPQPLTKSAAVAEIAARVGASHVVAAGDSALDADMLQCADRGVLPAHGELARRGWAAQHVTMLPLTGVQAGEGIVDWLSRAASESALAAAPASATQH